jgi:hypothetical protein
VVSDISETLREQKGRHEVAEKEDGDDQPRGVLDAHSRSTPFTMSATSAKNAPVRITNTRSDICLYSSHRVAWECDHDGSLCPETGCAEVLTGS